MSLDNLSHLAAFAAVARHSSFRKAGAELALSASAISYAIRGLEERLGVSLFNRTTRSVALTGAGQRLLERLQPALRDVDDALDEMNGFRGTPAGTLRINTSRVAAELLVGPLLARFLAAYPEVQVEVAENDGLLDIVGSGFDVGVRFEEAVPEDMVAVPIGNTQRMAIVASPAYMERCGAAPPRHPGDLLQHECIRYRFPSGRIYKWEFERKGVRLELDVKGRLVAESGPVAMQAALGGGGIACLLEDYVSELLAQGRLVRMLEDWCPRFPGFMLYYPRQRRMPPALRAFIDTVRAAA